MRNNYHYLKRSKCEHDKIIVETIDHGMAVIDLMDSKLRDEYLRFLGIFNLGIAAELQSPNARRVKSSLDTHLRPQTN